MTDAGPVTRIEAWASWVQLMNRPVITREQVESLLTGRFAIIWNCVAQNLTVEPVKLVETYQAAGDAGEFHMSILN